MTNDCSAAATIPSKIGTITTLNTDVTAVKSCFTDPSSSACSTAYSAASSLNKLVASMSTCFTDPTASACTTTYSGASTLPQVTQTHAN